MVRGHGASRAMRWLSGTMRGRLAPVNESQAPPASPGPFKGYGLTLITLGAFLGLTLYMRIFFPFLPYFLTGALTVVTVASAARFPRLEAQMSRWLLAAAFVAMAALAMNTLPEDPDPARDQHRLGIGVLCMWSFNAAVVLGVRLVEVRFAADRRPGEGGTLSLTDTFPRLLSIAVLGSAGVALFGLTWEGIG